MVTGLWPPINPPQSTRISCLLFAHLDLALLLATSDPTHEPTQEH
jgi:hypothetical protein